MKASLLALAAVLLGAVGLASAARAQQAADTVTSPDYRVSELDKLSFYDLNHDGRVDEKDRKLAEQIIKQMKAERLAQIKKYDKNGDGKLDAAENAVRLADEARERAQQKPSKAAVALSKPMEDY